jgi:uncharacterized ferritin-like protein (DUF455 family)
MLPLGMEPETPPTLRSFCERVLQSGDLASKLAEAPADLPDTDPGAACSFEWPARDPGLELTSGAEKLPKPGALHDPAARARCLARFAHHELMAVELFAWALLRWPTLPPGLRRALFHVLGEEQLHCRLYLERLAAHGSRLEEHPRSDYFWKHVGTIRDAEDGPRAFLCAMGLTLEQANLDFSALYRDAFREAGDEATAVVCERVHQDEIRHVRIAGRWLRALSGDMSDLEAYEACVPFPFGPNRAKGRRFDADARRQAGLSEAFIEAVRSGGPRVG